MKYICIVVLASIWISISSGVMRSQTLEMKSIYPPFQYVSAITDIYRQNEDEISIYLRSGGLITYNTRTNEYRLREYQVPPKLSNTINVHCTDSIDLYYMEYMDYGYADSMRGIFRSTDKGITWTMVSDLNNLSKFHIGRDNNYYITRKLLKSTEIYRSTDGGIRWQKLTEIPFTIENYFVDRSGRMMISMMMNKIELLVYNTNTDLFSIISDSSIAVEKIFAQSFQTLGKNLYVKFGDVLLTIESDLRYSTRKVNRNIYESTLWIDTIRSIFYAYTAWEGYPLFSDLCRSFDTGRTWHKLSTYPSTKTEHQYKRGLPNRRIYTDQYQGLMLIYGGQLIVSSRDEQKWQVVLDGYRNDIDLVEGPEGDLLYKSDVKYAEFYAHSTDSGKRWYLPHYIKNMNLHHNYYRLPNNSLLHTELNSQNDYRYSDSNYFKTYYSTTGNVQDMVFRSKNRDFATTTYGNKPFTVGNTVFMFGWQDLTDSTAIFQTSDSGKTWSVTAGTSTFGSEYTYTYNDDGKLYVLTPGLLRYGPISGSPWVPNGLYSNKFYESNYMFLTSNEEMIVNNYNTGVWLITDNWSNWQRISNDYKFRPESMIRIKDCFFFGTIYGLYKMSQDYLTITKVPMGSESSTPRVSGFFKQDNYLYIVTDRIWQVPLESITKLSTDIPEEHHSRILSQQGNILRATFNEHTNAEIDVYDMLGREILTESRREFSPGTTEISTAELKPGIYMITLRTPHSSEVMKYHKY